MNSLILYVPPPPWLIPVAAGESEAGYSKYVCAEVIPGSRVRVKFSSNLSINWLDVAASDGAVGASARFDFFAPNGITVLQPYEIKRSNYAQLQGVVTDPKSWASEVTPLSTWTCEIGGKVYYRLGKFGISGSARVEASPGAGSYTYNMNAGYGGEITGIAAYYIGNVLSIIPDTNNQTYLVEQKLPKELSVKVADGETGTLTNNIVPITFTIIEPSNGAKFPDGQTSISVNTENGIAGVKLTLGTVAGTYKVLATCPPEHCTSGAREVTFTSTAKTFEETTELRCELCDLSGRVAKELKTAFRVRAFNTLTNQYVGNLEVGYDKVKFIDKNGITKPAPDDMSIRIKNGTTDTAGFSRAYMTLGPEEGDYIGEATCNQCLGNKEVILRGHGKKIYIEVNAGKKVTLNPYDRDPITGEPITPLVRVKEIILPNENKSFTTVSSENHITLQAEVLPEDFAEKSEITW
ncbi:MAG: hypothetical protein COT17_03045, partial [Elusimicrobia bacterium CG08_land_8_20_14_0_20_51_18]